MANSTSFLVHAGKDKKRKREPVRIAAKRVSCYTAQAGLGTKEGRKEAGGHKKNKKKGYNLYRS